MKTPTKEQLAAALEAFHLHIGDWLEERQDSISTEEWVEGILLAALNQQEVSVGTYSAIAGGYTSVFTSNGKSYRVICENGIRGLGIPDSVTIHEDGRITSAKLGKGKLQ